MDSEDLICRILNISKSVFVCVCVCERERERRRRAGRGDTEGKKRKRKKRKKKRKKKRETVVANDGFTSLNQKRKTIISSSNFTKVYTCQLCLRKHDQLGPGDSTASNDCLEPLKSSLHTEIKLNTLKAEPIETGFSKYLSPCLHKLQNSFFTFR